MINEKNFWGVLGEFTMDRYGRKLKEFHARFYSEFPYKFEGLPDEKYFKNFLDWLAFEKVLPETGKTILDEFVEAHPEIDKELKQKLLQMKNVIRSAFAVLSKKGMNLKIKDLRSRINYNVVLPKENPYFDVNDLLIGRICPFGESYKLLGIVKIEKRSYLWNTDVMMEQFSQMNISDAEEMVLSPKSRMTAILNKYPSQWVDGICVQFSIDTRGRKNIKVKIIASKVGTKLSSILGALPKKSIEALKIVLDNGGFVEYSRLKDYDDEVTFWWKEEPPTSTIGILRLNALLAVGKMPMEGRMYKVALIPFDIREKLQELL